MAFPPQYPVGLQNKTMAVGERMESNAARLPVGSEEQFEQQLAL